MVVVHAKGRRRRRICAAVATSRARAGEAEVPTGPACTVINSVRMQNVPGKADISQTGRVCVNRMIHMDVEQSQGIASTPLQCFFKGGRGEASVGGGRWRQRYNLAAGPGGGPTG